MNLTEMQTYLRFLVDDTVEFGIAVTLFNAGISKMGVEVKATFPLLNSSNSVASPVFPEKYHELPVLYAAARYKEYDSSIRESQNFAGQFAEGLTNFAENYTVPARYKDDFNVQQYVVSEEGTKEFKINKDGFNPQYSELRAYVDDVQRPYTLDTENSTFTIEDDTVDGTCVTAIWEIRSEFTTPPMPWWEGLP